MASEEGEWKWWSENQEQLVSLGEVPNADVREQFWAVGICEKKKTFFVRDQQFSARGTFYTGKYEAKSDTSYLFNVKIFNNLKIQQGRTDIQLECHLDPDQKYVKITKVQGHTPWKDSPSISRFIPITKK